MHTMPGRCPVCQETLNVTELHCRQCDTTIRGHFAIGAAATIDAAKLPALQPFVRLSAEQLAFVETFVKNEGKITRVEEELNLSYPTVRARLHEVIRALGHQPRDEQQQPPQETPRDASFRARILEELAAGRLTADDAARQLRGQ